MLLTVLAGFRKGKQPHRLIPSTVCVCVCVCIIDFTDMLYKLAVEKYWFSER